MRCAESGSVSAVILDRCNAVAGEQVPDALLRSGCWRQSMSVREIRIRPQNRMSPQQRLRSSVQIVRLVDAEAARPETNLGIADRPLGMVSES